MHKKFQDEINAEAIPKKIDGSNEGNLGNN